jgi:hypothetical protein
MGDEIISPLMCAMKGDNSLLVDGVHSRGACGTSNFGGHDKSLSLGGTPLVWHTGTRGA